MPPYLTKKVVPTYPRKLTLLGIPAVSVDTLRAFSECVPVKYQVTVEKASGFLCEGTVVSHLDLQDYLSMRKLNLVSLDATPELARPGELSSIR
jgi:hypothetical protein